MSVDDSNKIQPDISGSSYLWDYMTKQKEKAKCNICSAVLSRKNGTTSGLRKHLCQMHKLECFSVNSKTVDIKPHQIGVDEKKKLDSLIINAIVEDGRSFGDMRQSGILKVFNHLTPGYSPPHRNTVQRRLKRLQSEQKLTLTKELSKIQSLGVTCDFWSDKRLYSYLCLTGHYITPKYQFVSKILSFSWFHHRHSSTNISMVIKKELKELNVFEKTRSITTDCAANMSKIGDTLYVDTKQIFCVAHRLHLVVCNGLGLWTRKQKTLYSSNTDAIPKIDISEDDSDEEDFTDDVQFMPQPSSITNSSSSLESVGDALDVSYEVLNTYPDNNVITNENLMDEEPDHFSNDIIDNWSIDVIEDLDTPSNETVQQNIGDLMKKCRSMVKLINKSSILMNYVVKLKQQFNIRRSLQLDCKSRWNSSHQLIEVMLMYKKIINKIHNEKRDIGLNKKQMNKLSLIELDQFDWKMLELLDFVLKPFVQATKLLNGTLYPTIGISYFAIVQIRDFLEDSNTVDVDDWKILFNFKVLLLNQLEKYFCDKDEQWQTMKNHAYFDPVGYGCLTRRERRAVESNVIESHEQHTTEDMIDEQEVNRIESKLNMKRKFEPSRQSSMTKFLNSVGKKVASSSINFTTTNKNTLSEEIATYRTLAQREYNSIVDGDKDSDVMQFWQSHQLELQHLSKIAASYLSTPAISVSSESAFSTASYLLRKQWSHLTPVNLSHLMFLKDKLQTDFNA
ncbi:unnamed protein product [Rotaria sp. Silwood2]|nr:unnamed protein product [Rotaria sp. Silwood2]CAF2586361.1 unnamed protein product [Rotaria sp. Silwood2]CAF2835766.1 unnamed protein product [Rotaria sp. Silwood2]CAF2998633.1 unnamed protein product [Rotaria sp. Silwood2]CAF4014496.1 unnamed protein product [Rotaria sp. Silwood2]